MDKISLFVHLLQTFRVLFSESYVCVGLSTIPFSITQSSLSLYNSLSLSAVQCSVVKCAQCSDQQIRDKRCTSPATYVQ